MTDRVTSLEALIEKVEVGIWDAFLIGSVFEFNDAIRIDAYRAFDGSLDAAKSLHDAVLCDIDPQYGYLVGPQYASIVHPSCVTVCDAQSNNPARAWVLAILYALLEQERSLDALK